MSVSHNCAGEEVREEGGHREQPRDNDELESRGKASHVGDLLWSSCTEMLLRQAGVPGQ